jgi:hypothetical protein
MYIVGDVKEQRTDDAVPTVYYYTRERRWTGKVDGEVPDLRDPFDRLCS